MAKKPSQQTHPIMTREESHAFGTAMRKQSPHHFHAVMPGQVARNPLAILAETDQNRIGELVPERYKRMAVSPFAFFRGSAAIMAQDLATHATAGMAVQACGDCHIMNFGAFAAQDGQILFDINDFDETLAGVDFTIDLKRLASSVVIAAQSNQLSEKKAHKYAMSAAKAYRKTMARYAQLSPLDIWQRRVDLMREISRIADQELCEKLQHVLIKKDGQKDDNFPHYHLTKQGKWEIKDKKPTIYHFKPDSSPKNTIDAAKTLQDYLTNLDADRRSLLDRYDFKDMAFKVVGVGSVGTYCTIALLLSPDLDPLFLQFKEARGSVLERLEGAKSWAGHQGQRVVIGQRLIQGASDMFLGQTTDQKTGRQFYVRQLKNHRLSSITDIIETDALKTYAKLCGHTLARAHARSGNAAMIAGYLGDQDSFDEAMGDFAMAYAIQNKADYDALMQSRAAAINKP